MQRRYLSLLLLAAVLAAADAELRRRLLAPGGSLQFKLKDRPGGAVKFLADLDKDQPGRVSKFLMNSGIGSRQKLLKLLNDDDDL
jgi:hypothetical protein